MTNSNAILALADQCVKCGLCLPQCPTYNLSLNENESPRGRIALIQAITSGQINVSRSLKQHLDHCLMCRRCERVCPSKVQYGKLVQQAHTMYTSLTPTTSLLGRLGLWLIEKPQRLKLMRRLLRSYQQSGVQALLRITGFLKILRLEQIDARLPEISKPFNTTPDSIKQKKSVALFTGCSQTIFDTNAIASAHKLLSRLGYKVVIPDNQVCCGALHNTQGRTDKSQQLLRQNSKAFKQTEVETVLYLSSGCGAFIKEQSDNYDALGNFQEITDFLVDDATIEKLNFKPLQNKIAVHMPCSQKNVLCQDNTAFELLQHIPEITLFNLEQSGCCGAGGTTMVSHPKLADKVRQPLLEIITHNDCFTVVTTNPGCQLHLQHGFKVQNSDTRVIHPVTLLAQQLEA